MDQWSGEHSYQKQQRVNKCYDAVWITRNCIKTHKREPLKDAGECLAMNNQGPNYCMNDIQQASVLKIDILQEIRRTL